MPMMRICSLLANVAHYQERTMKTRTALRTAAQGFLHQQSDPHGGAGPTAGGRDLGAEVVAEHTRIDRIREGAAHAPLQLVADGGKAQHR